MRILVVQTTRMGDVVQTTPLLRAIRIRFPDARIDVLVRRMGKSIAARNPDVNGIIVYDEDEIFLDMRSGDSDRLLNAYRVADERIRQIRETQYDRAYNVTHSVASAMLLKLAEIPEVVGAHLSDDWQFLLRGPWTTYFFMSVLHREFNDLNLCDITRHFEPEADARDLIFDVLDEDREAVAELLRGHAINDGTALAVLQLGASEENKRWPEVSFASLAKRLQAEYGFQIVLVGVDAEAPLGANFEQHAPGLALHLYGKTNIPQLAALLERASILVTNDTGTMHVAAAVGCPITLVSVGHVHYRETGPYGEGHCAIEWRRALLGSGHHVPTGLEERQLIRPEHVMQAVACTLAYRETGALPDLEETPELAPLDLLFTRFSPDGCLEYYPLLRRSLTHRDFVRAVYRCMWLATMDPNYTADAESNALALLLRCYRGPEDAQITAWAAGMRESLDGLTQLAQRGRDASAALRTHLADGGSMAQAKDMVGALMRLDDDMRIHSELHPACRPLIVTARHERDALEGGDVVKLTETTQRIYEACHERALLLQEKATNVETAWRALSQ